MKDYLIIKNVYNVMQQNQVICSYHGDFSYKVVNSLLITIKNRLNQNQLLKKAAKKTYKVVVECLENVHKHSHSNENFFKSGFFVLIEESTGYKVSVGNFVTQEMRIDLEKKINQVNEMNEEQLKNTYREIITSTDISAKGGASLGLIDMALKSGNKLHYTFNQHKSSNNFFILDILINN